jgi:type IV secretion system protein VirD4
LVAPLLYTAATTGRSILDVRDWVHGFDLATPLTLLEEMAVDGTRRADDAVRAITMLISVDQRPEKERATVFSTVMRVFSPLHERAVADSAMSSRFDADTFLRRNGTLYLCTPRQSPERIAGLFVGVLMTVVSAAYAQRERHAHPDDRALGLFLDEVANVVPIDDLPSLASQGAGRGVLLMSVIQDMSQLRARYGPDRAASILNNHGCKLILPGIADPDTAEVMSRLIGRGRFVDVAVNRGDDGRGGRAYTVRHDAMAPPDALRQLKEGTAIALHRGRPPALLRLQPWYRDRVCRRRAQRPYVRNAEFVGRA